MPRTVEPGSRSGPVFLGVALVVALTVVAVLIVVVSKSDPRPQVAAVIGPTTRTGRDRPVRTPTVSQPALAQLLPSTSTPLRVLEIGDSLGIDLGDQLEAQLDATAMASTVVASVGDSGLSNTAYLDWPGHLAGLLATDRPQIVVVFMGANDDQGLYVNGIATAPDTLAWVAAYSRRVDDLVHEATGSGTRLVWVGMPLMANPALNAAMQREDAIYARETADVPAALYVSSVAVLDPAGVYETDGEDLSGRQGALRTPDGVHLTPAGAGVLARAVISAVDQRWHVALLPTATAPTTN